MQVATLQVERREATGSKQVRSLRATGKIPMVLYGGSEEPAHLQAEYHPVKIHLSKHLRVYKLQLDGKEQAGYLKDVQWDCLTDEPLHLDLLRIDMDKPLNLEVELRTFGVPKGESQGGRLVLDKPKLPLACAPASVPEYIELPIADLGVGTKVFAKDLPLPEGCQIDMPEDTLILHVTNPDG